MFGVGIAQDIKAAEMKLYALFRHYEADVTFSDGAGNRRRTPTPLEDLDILMTGAIIKF